MNIEKAISLAGDCDIDLSADDDDPVQCLFVHGEGIELHSEREVELATMIVEALDVLRLAMRRQRSRLVIKAGD